MATYLDAILDWHRARAVADDRDLVQLRATAERATADDPPRGFARSLVGADGLSVIAEIKRRSPSRGDLAADLDPVGLVRDYERGGAAALSVLTDHPHFGGSAADLSAARSATALPVLRKDFTVWEGDVCDARIMGADCVLLIVAALDDDELRRLHRLAVELGMDAMVETHDEAEVARAQAVGATLIGVNQRDLVTFEVDHERAVRVARTIGPDVVAVAESGVRGPGDAESLAAAGYRAVLVGESLVTSADPAAAVAALRGV